MFCPRCGQARVSEATSFCSGCGFLLTGTAELIATGGSPLLPRHAEGPSPRSRGIRMGLFMMLLTFVIAPLVGIIATFALGMDPWPVGVVTVLLFFGGLLRIVYAFMFESSSAVGLPSAGTVQVEAAPATKELTAPASSYIPPDSAFNSPRSAFETPASVTESTTRHLKKDGDASD